MSEEKKEKKEKKPLTLDQLKKQINKAYGAGTITTANKAVSVKLVRIPTGSLTLDCETGGGYPRGRLTIIAGHESAGKSFLAYMAVAEAQKMYPDQSPWWIDQEGSFVAEWAENFGIDLDRLEVVRPNTAEQALDITSVLLDRSDIPLVVFDSIAGAAPSAEVEGSMEDFTMGLAARQNNKFFRKAQARFNTGSMEEENLKPALLMINQLRDTMDKYKPETMPGGRGQLFTASIIIWVRVASTKDRYIETQDGDEVYVGHAISFKTEKNKTFPPKRTGKIDIYVADSQTGFKAGQVDRLKEIIVYAVKFGVIKKAGAWFKIFGDDDMKFQGGASILEYLRENEDTRLEVERQVLTLATSSIRVSTEEISIVTEDGLEIDPETGEILE